MRATFHDHASAELLAASHWYEARRAGLGNEFLVAVERAIRQVEDHPDRFPLVPHLKTRRQFRRILVHGFPYLVVYEIKPAGPRVLAVAHGSQRHGYWRSRR